MIIIAGLGNPGNEYKHNRHNIGFMFIDNILSRYADVNIKVKFNAETAKIKIDNHDIVLIKPQSYMNNSGKVVRQVTDFYKVKANNVIIAHDELDLKFTEVKTKFAGGSAGHNGLKDIDNHIGNEYHRIRIGISHPRNIEGSNIDVASYVLQDFTAHELNLVDDIFKDATIKLHNILNII
jgi:PTH1 family peptidyl-tRNA hydrolase